jgi:UDP:flavonoid glycosyltransferase YjiC (YdhE family)
MEILVTVSADHPLGVGTPRNATVLGYHPHADVLPSMDAVVTTSGYGITSKALWFGKPLVTVPRARDQHYVAAAAQQAGCGLTVAWPPKPDSVATAVDAVLSSPALREHARRLSGPMPGFPSASDVAAEVLSLATRT